ncbi:unnamed protein product [Haemonchus placei]|uniref:BPTI/Kunitz inhibitor domain-containing protein n=1 Tax=Haemonchus placei TaxID=6290 RepID=A0A3P7V2B5_HAEPC|nr:unnamed protein product [Haemonchus placei]
MNDDGMKCTKKGYYETVQCDARGCVCVAANNGLVAFDTRTSNNMTQPKCSSRFTSCKKPSKLDLNRLLFDPVQQEYCYCVDTKTGKEVPNTRKRKEGNNKQNCHNVFASDFPTTEGSPFVQERYPVSRESCKLDRNKGRACKEGKPSVRYYFDYHTFECLAFEYLGCDGNENNYPTSSACNSDCKLGTILPQNDLFLFFSFFLVFNPPCITTPAPRNTPKLNEDGCPLDHKCVMGAFFGFCCNRANEDRFHAAYHPKCSNGKQPYSEMIDSWREIRFGKSCKDNFCPSGYKCHDGDIFAYCC